ncbi:MFS transporter [Streptomyces niveus]|uniref:MFS transporter n=1 Tax=Streptomyces niveus TaxID=193462 RepID=UPI0034207214
MSPRTTSPTQPASAATGRWPPTLWAVLIGSFAVRGFGFAYPFLPYHLDELGFSTTTTGWIVAAFGAGWLLGQVLCGWLSDRFGHRATLVAAMTLATVILPVLAEVRTVAAVFPATLVAGMVYDAARPVVSVVIADAVPRPADQALVNGWRHFAVNAGAALTGSLGGYLASTAGTAILFWANAVACGLFGLAALHFLPARHADQGRGIPDREAYRAAFHDVRLLLLSVASLCGLICAGGVFTALPLLMAADGLDVVAYGWTQVANAAAVLLLSPLLTPWLSRRTSDERPMTGLLALSVLLLAGAMGIAGLSDSMLGYSFASAAAVPGEIILFIAAGDLVMRIAPTNARGLYAGLWGSNLATAITIAPLMTSWAIGHGGDLTASVSTLTVGVLGAFLCLPLHHQLAPRDPSALHTSAPSDQGAP